MLEGDIAVSHYAIALAVPVLVTQVVTPLVISAARRMDLVDAPDDGRRIHQVAVPRLGGVAVLGALTVALYLLSDVLGPNRGLQGVFAGCCILAGIGLVDDIRGVTPRIKVVGQVLAAAVAWWFAPQFTGVAIGYGNEISVGWLGFPLLAGWVVVVSNGYNLIDGINGLAASVGIVASAAAAAIAFALGNHQDGLVALALGMALIGFVRFNFPRARIFLGDAGSLSVGFVLAMLTVRSATKPSGSVLVVLPLLALVVPLFETGLTIVRRWLRSVSVVTADAHHIHHRLLAMGLEHQGATLVLASAAAIFASVGVALALAGPTMVWVFTVLAIGALILMLLMAVSVLSYHEIAIAGAVVARGPARARRVIRDQIAATDLAAKIVASPSLDDINRLLDANAYDFGFARLALMSRGSEVVSADPPGRVWKLEYPLVAPPDLPSFIGFSLCVLCSATSGSRPFGAERVIHILAPALDLWLQEHSEELAQRYAADIAERKPRVGVSLRLRPSAAS